MEVNLKNKFLIVIIFILCYCHIPIDTSYCISNWDCNFDEMYINGMCIYEQEALPSGFILLDCGCWEYNFIEDDMCLSSFSTKFYCYNWCPNGNLEYGIICE